MVLKGGREGDVNLTGGGMGFASTRLDSVHSVGVVITLVVGVG